MAHLMGESSCLLETKDLSKAFQGQAVLKGVSLSVESGEVHALVGQNGSGKSTLVKVLAGYHQSEIGGSVQFNGHDLDLGSPAAARAAGLRFVHQEMGLIPELDVVDNLALGEAYLGSRWLSARRERKAAREILERFEVDIDPSKQVSELSAAERTMLAVVRSLRDVPRPCLLVLDESTATLPEQEVRAVFRLVDAIRRRGGAVLYVTHRLAEIFEIADRVTVLRDGEKVATALVSAIDHDRLVELMIGRPIEYFNPSSSATASKSVLEVKDLAGGRVRGVTAEVRRGEVVGVTGVVGSGYEELLGVIFGARPRTDGDVVASGTALPGGSPARSIRAGIAYASADRRRSSAIMDWNVRENLTLPKLPHGRLRWMARRQEVEAVLPWLERLEVVPRDPERLYASLSGGNQQKVVIARWLRAESTIFLLDEPTNGVDTGAKQAIYTALSQAAASGAGVLLASSDLEELCAICNRVLVMRSGKIACALEGTALTVDRLAAESLRADRS